MEHNDPKGQGQEFNSILIGQRSQLVISSSADVTPISDSALKSRTKQDYPSRIKYQIKQKQRQFPKSEAKQPEVVELGKQSVLGHQQSHDSILKDTIEASKVPSRKYSGTLGEHPTLLAP